MGKWVVEQLVGAFQVQMDADASLNVSRDCLSYCLVLQKREASSKSFLLLDVISYVFVVGWDRLSYETREERQASKANTMRRRNWGPRALYSQTTSVKDARLSSSSASIWASPKPNIGSAMPIVLTEDDQHKVRAPALSVNDQETLSFTKQMETMDYGVKLMDPSEAFVRPTYHLVPAKAIN
jgi:hypothetical protein